MWEKIKKSVIEQVMWAEKNLKGKNGAEKRKAVVSKLDELIKLPSSLEWVDDGILGWLVDRVCDQLNELTRHNFGGIELSESQERDIADEIPDPEDAFIPY